MLGDWFPAAWSDPARRAHGIAFPTVGERRAYAPERRLAGAAIHSLTPPLRDPAEQHWTTYPPVALGDPDAALELLLDPSRWPDIGCRLGRFTALRSGGLLGQTFEIEVVADTAPRLPVFTRGYVSCEQLHAPGSATPAAAVAVLDAHSWGREPAADSMLAQLALCTVSTSQPCGSDATARRARELASTGGRRWNRHPPDAAFGARSGQWARPVCRWWRRSVDTPAPVTSTRTMTPPAPMAAELHSKPSAGTGASDSNSIAPPVLL